MDILELLSKVHQADRSILEGSLALFLLEFDEFIEDIFNEGKLDEAKRLIELRKLLEEDL